MNLSAWQGVLQAMHWADQPAAAARSPAAEDDDFDFLDVQPAPTLAVALQPFGAPSAADSERGREVAAASADLDAAAAELAATWQSVADAPALASLDADGALLLCRVLARTRELRCMGRNPLCLVLERAIASADLTLSLEGLGAAHMLQAHEVQLVIAERLARDPRTLSHAQVDRFLACLEQLGDGRIVRTLEALLHQDGASLSEVHAWRTRHIIQSIRRGGRK